MDSIQIQDLCKRYSEAGFCERNRLQKKIAEYAAAKARRLDKIARRFSRFYHDGFFSVKAGDYIFNSWYGGEIHIFLPSDPDIDIGVPFKAFDPGYEKEYAAALAEKKEG